MSRSRNRLLLLLSVVGTLDCCLGAGTALAQTVELGKIAGTVRAPTGEPLPGATLTLTSDALVSGQRSTIASGDGNYVFLALPIGEYTLAVNLDGFRPYVQEGIAVSAGSTRTIDVPLELGGIEEAITVTSTPLFDTKNSGVAASFGSELLEKVPTARDAFYDLAVTAPGMAPVGANGSWLPSPSAYGSATNENIFLVNGVNTTNPRGSSWGSLVNVNYDTVEEVRVIAIGPKAEYGSFSGAAIDVLTKSGSNKFHGTASYYSLLDADDNQPQGTKDFGEDWLYAAAGDELTTKPEDSWEANATLGGPVLRDKLWFYTGFARWESKTDTPIFQPLATWNNDIFDLKLTTEPVPSLLLSGAYHFEDNTAGNQSWSNVWDPTMVYDQNAENDTYSFIGNWAATDRTVVSAKYLGFETNQKPTIPGGGPTTPGYINWWKWGQYGVAGAFPYVEAQKSKRDTLQADVSYYAEEFLGQHDMKFGVQYTKGEGNWQGGYFHGYANFAYPEPWTYSVQYLKDWYGDTGLRFYVNEVHFNPFLTVRESDSTGVFMDDQWTINDRLTLNLGLRYDDMTAGYGEGAVYAQPASPGDINSPVKLRSRAGTDAVFDFQTWSPRLGATYALTDDGKTLLRANIGRYYAPISVENLRRFGPDMPLAHTYVLHYSVPFDISDADGDGTISYDEMVNSVRQLPNLTPTSIDDLGTTDPSWQLNVAPGLDDTHTDQLTLSLGRQLTDNLAVEAMYVYKNTTDIMVNWPINEVTGGDWEWDRVPYTTRDGNTYDVWSIKLKDYNGDGAVDVEDARWVTTHQDSEVRNLGSIDGIDPDREYQGFQLVVQKRQANRWQLAGSVLYSDGQGVAPRTTDQNWYIEGPMIMDTPFVASPNQLVNNMQGHLPMLPKFAVKLAGSYTLPKAEVDLGFRLRYNTGRPFWPVEVVPQFASWMSSLDGVILSTGGETGGSIVAVDSGDADYLPASTILDLSLRRDFNVGFKDASVGVHLDALNLLNEDAVTSAGFRRADYGRVYALENPRTYRLGLRFDF
jgi:outer membrane receptor protein involved in Fe transport